MTYPIISYDISLYLSILVHFTCTYQTVLSLVGVKNIDSSVDTRRYFLTYTLLNIKSTYISISCSYLYPFLPCISFNFNQAISTLGTTIQFSDKIWEPNAII